MADTPDSYLVAIELEELRLRERLEKLALFKLLAQELDIKLTAVSGVPGPISIVSNLPVPVGDVSQIEFNGTVAGLAKCYLTDKRSPFQQLRHSVRNNYEGSINRIVTDMGNERVGDLNSRRILEYYENWSAGGKVAMGHGLAGKLRLLSGYGTTVLNNDACIRLSGILHKMRFKLPKARTERMTIEHVNAVRYAAHEMGWHSIALAQAFQFDLDILQKDVIGEWVPITEPGFSDVSWGNEKWIRGLRWSEIDQSMVLRHPTINRVGAPKEIVFDLKQSSMVLEEIAFLGEHRADGPVIICEATGRPYSTAEFRRKWRLVADKAGLPKNVRNSDSARPDLMGTDGSISPSGKERSMH